MRKIAIIPCYDEDIDCLIKIVKVTSKFVDKVLIIDDGNKLQTSIDNCLVFKNKKRMGKGYSLRKGFRYALKNKFDLIITLDGDGEHNPADIIKFENKIKENDIILGQRSVYRSKIRKILNHWSSVWIKLLTPGINDANCGFRAIKRSLLRNMYLTSDGFEIEIEMILEAIKNKAKIGLVQIQSNINKKSNIKPKDCIETNNLFDKWVLKNKNYININPFKKRIIVTSAFIGLNISQLIKWLLQKY